MLTKSATCERKLHQDCGNFLQGFDKFTQLTRQSITKMESTIHIWASKNPAAKSSTCPSQIGWCSSAVILQTIFYAIILKRKIIELRLAAINAILFLQCDCVMLTRFNFTFAEDFGVRHCFIGHIQSARESRFVTRASGGPLNPTSYTRSLESSFAGYIVERFRKRIFRRLLRHIFG
ncbi:hypothetical protein CSKR_101143 [Clonorchis sinensis]|uniref:Uncharacterized protein n=1 Tax=Clonorchis sinensis TaxID=79923 RepID=A0A3R7G6N5_CLOSI|nr:hypothetical protein CSKR_101143 [Clonorchis sinensis]